MWFGWLPWPSIWNRYLPGLYRWLGKGLLHLPSLKPKPNRLWTSMVGRSNLNFLLEIHPGKKFTFWTQSHGGLVQMIFRISSWVIFLGSRLNFLGSLGHFQRRTWKGGTPFSLECTLNRQNSVGDVPRWVHDTYGADEAIRRDTIAIRALPQQKLPVSIQKSRNHPPKFPPSISPNNNNNNNNSKMTIALEPKESIISLSFKEKTPKHSRIFSPTKLTLSRQHQGELEQSKHGFRLLSDLGLIQAWSKSHRSGSAPPGDPDAAGGGKICQVKGFCVFFFQLD